MPSTTIRSDTRRVKGICAARAPGEQAQRYRADDDDQVGGDCRRIGDDRDIRREHERRRSRDRQRCDHPQLDGEQQLDSARPAQNPQPGRREDRAADRQVEGALHLHNGVVGQEGAWSGDAVDDQQRGDYREGHADPHCPAVIPARGDDRYRYRRRRGKRPSGTDHREVNGRCEHHHRHVAGGQQDHWDHG
jgi:hypothetical protein